MAVPKAKQLEFGFFKKMKLEAGRLKPTTVDISMRRRDFRAATKQFFSSVSNQNVTHLLRDAKPVVIGNPMSTSLDGRSVKRKIEPFISKEDKRGMEDLRKCYDILKREKFRNFEVAGIKSDMKTMSQLYFQRPSLEKLIIYMHRHTPRPGEETDYKLCAEFVSKNPKINIDLLIDTVRELRPFLSQKPFSHDGIREMPISNFIVFGMTSEGKLKIGLVDT